MSWSSDRDVLFCREILVSNLFNTRKSSIERGQVWESIAQKLCDIREPAFRVDQRSVRDHYKKLIQRYSKIREELNASEISPEKSELDVLLEEIVERDAVAEAEKENAVDGEKKRTEADKVAADDMRRKAKKTLAEKQKRKEGEESAIKKRRQSGGETVVYLRERAEKEMEIRKEELNFKRAEADQEKERQRQQAEYQAKMFSQQENMMKAMLEQHQQQQQQMQQMQLMILQQQQQQSQALMALLEKLSK
ncbi:nucleoporin GLE1-like [Dendronephthya gigantea]|uniref:nucleoporin GLE1-like n=1 Tax=Dendronephthya gigantea TaxID=151771 RepID=UPI00106CC627|nr:nucleoporin GLE1-like [Dendronephthya gigantea]